MSYQERFLLYKLGKPSLIKKMKGFQFIILQREFGNMAKNGKLPSLYYDMCGRKVSANGFFSMDRQFSYDRRSYEY